MFTAFKERRPWPAVLLAFVLGPVVAMLFLNRWRFAVLYFVAVFVMFAIYPWVATTFAIGDASTQLLFILAFQSIGSTHAYFVARNRTSGELIGWYARWYSVISIILVLNIALLTLRAFVIQPFNAPSGSMLPTLAPGDYFFVSKLVYRTAMPRRGDVIVFLLPRKHNRFVKRIIGIPGDRVQMIDGIDYVNGKASQRRRIADFNVDAQDCIIDVCSLPQFLESLPGSHPFHIVQRSGLFLQDNTPVFHVPPGHYFVLGDNRENSMDSRMDDFGLVQANEIVGKATYKYFDGAHKRWVWHLIN